MHTKHLIVDMYVPRSSDHSCR